jgi:hypothetical protein
VFDSSSMQITKRRSKVNGINGFMKCRLTHVHYTGSNEGIWNPLLHDYQGEASKHWWSFRVTLAILRILTVGRVDRFPYLALLRIRVTLSDEFK